VGPKKHFLKKKTVARRKKCKRAKKARKKKTYKMRKKNEKKKKVQKGKKKWCWPSRRQFHPRTGFFGWCTGGCWVTQAVKKRKMWDDNFDNVFIIPEPEFAKYCTCTCSVAFSFLYGVQVSGYLFQFSLKVQSFSFLFSFLLNVFLRSTFWSFFTWVSFLHRLSLLAHLWPINLMPSMNSIFRVG